MGRSPAGYPDSNYLDVCVGDMEAEEAEKAEKQYLHQRLFHVTGSCCTHIPTAVSDYRMAALLAQTGNHAGRENLPAIPG